MRIKKISCLICILLIFLTGSYLKEYKLNLESIKIKTSTDDLITLNSPSSKKQNLNSSTPNSQENLLSIPGDLNNDEEVDTSDVIYLLMHTYFSEQYPVEQNCDYNSDNVIDTNDVIYLLMHTYFSNEYPLDQKVNNTTYTVTFLDKRGDILSSTTVKKGNAATAPDAPIIDFYKFVKWDTDFSNVTSDLTIKPIYEKTHTTYDISNVNYWLQILTDKYDLQEELLTRAEINNYNQSILSDYSKTKVVDITKITSSTTGTYVKGLINNYSNINKYTVYNSSTNKAISSTEKNNILNNRALNNITTTVTVKYGLIVDFAWMRSYPTNHYSSDYYMDRFQETSLNVGEGVAIYHTSSDGNWYFVQAQNYNGWVEKKYIAECSYDQMITFLNPTERLVVISNYETIEGTHVRMGQSFPLLSKETNYQISFPTRSSNGLLNLKTITLTNKDSYSVGYLSYNYENIFKQAFKLLGINYSWGDKELNGRDCSSTMNAIYHCFGFMMPRNTSNQVSIPTYSTRINGITSTVMKTYNPGTLIYSSGHVMMYIGENESGNCYILHNTTSGNGECILQSLNSFGGSRIIGTLKLQ